MSDWVQCQGYTEAREKFWVNLDHVAVIKSHDNGSILVFAIPDDNGQLEHVVWDRPEDLLPIQRGR